MMSKLREYQRQGVDFLVERDAAMLADEMGLGKTVQTIAAISLLRKLGKCSRAIVIVPRSLSSNWIEEFHTWAPRILVREVVGNLENRKALYNLPIPVLIATYEQVRIDSKYLSSVPSPFELVVLDEAQRIKNPNSKANIACSTIPRDRSWALTGTPLENKLEDLVGIFRFVEIGLLSTNLPVRELHNRLKPKFLRRKKVDILPELPPIIYQDLNLVLTGSQRASYRSIWNTREDRLSGEDKKSKYANMLAVISELKKTCNFDPVTGESVKAQALKELLSNLGEPEDKVIIFSQYVRTLEKLMFEIEDIPSKIFHGGLKKDERDEVIKWFRSSKGPSVLLVSLKAGGVGLNLQEAGLVVLFDRWWNPSVEQQAIHRAHRFGRQRPLHVIRFLVKDTIEERIENILQNKLDRIELYIEGAESAESSNITKSDMIEILEIGTIA